MRSDLPSNLARVIAPDPARLETFHSALEQSQQQFAAAAAIGYESRPLNLFYGLSQAGRAISAASESLGGSTGAPWRSSGHGVRFVVPLTAELMSSVVRVEPSKQDSLSRVMTALRVSPHSFGVSVGDILTQIPDYWMEFQDPDPVKPPIADLAFYDASVFPSVHGIELPGVKRSDGLSHDAILAALRLYPALDQLHLVVDEHNEPVWIGDARLSFEVTEDVVTRAGGVRLKGTTVYRRHDFLLPGVPSGENLLPVPAWWLFLHALSMLARYAPDDWTRTMNIRTSPIASRVEFLMDVALDAVPEILLEALVDLNGSGH